MFTIEIFQRYNLESFVGCYFPADFQGEFVTQVNGRGMAIEEPIQYSTINISTSAISVWGYCFKRVGDNVLLIDRYNDSPCIRCFQLVRRGRNIIEVFSEALNRCYINETDASRSCGALNTTSILYRTKEFEGSPPRNEFCPIAGLYHFRYSMRNNSAISYECSTFSSEFHNCPDGSVLQLNFKRCNFETHDYVYNCLGSWPGPNNSRYFVLSDSNNTNGSRPQYRCGLYHVDNKRGKTYMALSSDSSCTQNLDNSTSGYETLTLSKSLNQKKVPDFVKTHVATFPKWAQGLWENSLIVNGTMTFTDVNGYNSYTFITVESNEKRDRYIVYSTDQCEQAAYACLMMKQRGENVLEFALGTNLYPVYQSTLCDDSNFGNLVWMTQTRADRLVESSCPITGRYTGMIPDAPGMCTELSSNCNNREIMYFKVSDCASGTLFEKRTYHCLGQWEEKGLIYAYTMKNVTAQSECFVGKIVNEEELYIAEAGNHCLRNIDPKVQGMRLYRKGHCYGNSPSPAPIIPIPHNPIMRITTPRSRTSDNTRVPENTVSSSTLLRSTTSTSFMLLISVIIALLEAAFPYAPE
ncbi:PREDICTED: uncharacterized protein LOC105567627 isoform X2 [Vollenhovia emeryi]|nr:PREDICTED: uncharacterized protein LOC105567627 isoform X2 [Vollenhovia emeryi]